MDKKLRIEDLPEEYQWVDLSNSQFCSLLEEMLSGKGNLHVQGSAGCGKSLLIKMFTAMRENVVVLSTTATTALQLSSDGIPAKTIHSFFQLPPVPIIPTEALKKYYPDSKKVLNCAKVIIIDEVSMLSSHLFDMIISKIKLHRKNHDVPRLIVFGDVLQLPPVVPNDGVVSEFYQKTYGGKIMFFNSKSYNSLRFKRMNLTQKFRQKDEEFADNIFNIGYGLFDENSLRYFDDRVMPLDKYEQTHPKFIYLSTTNATVNRINKEYIENLASTEFKVYKATKSPTFPANLIEDEILIKKGAQVMMTRNNYEAGYTNGLIATVIDFDNEFISVETEDGRILKVGKSKYEIKKPQVNKFGRISYITESWAIQMDCKICKAMTIHKSQGKTLDNAYIALCGWFPPSALYVALSRLTTKEGLGLSRKIKPTDIQIFKEAMDFLQQSA